MDAARAAWRRAPRALAGVALGARRGSAGGIPAHADFVAGRRRRAPGGRAAVNVGVMLAAGASRRMGKNKALMRVGGISFFVRGVRHLWSACDAVVVVLGADARRARSTVEEEFVRLVHDGRLHRDLE